MTLWKISRALFVQMNGFGLALCSAMYCSIAATNSGALVNTSRRRRSVVISRENRLTVLSQGPK